ARLPDAAAGDRERDVRGVAWIDHDRMDTRVVVAAAEPVLPQRVLPQAAHQLPALAAVVGEEQARGQGAGPEPAGARLERPDHVDGPRRRIVLPRALGGLGREGGRGHLLPARPAVAAALDLHAE